MLPLTWVGFCPLGEFFTDLTPRWSQTEIFCLRHACLAKTYFDILRLLINLVCAEKCRKRLSWKFLFSRKNRGSGTNCPRVCHVEEIPKRHIPGPNRVDWCTVRRGRTPDVGCACVPRKYLQDDNFTNFGRLDLLIDLTNSGPFGVCNDTINYANFGSISLRFSFREGLKVAISFT
jgi:hypothetical protein